MRGSLISTVETTFCPITTMKIRFQQTGSILQQLPDTLIR